MDVQVLHPITHSGVHYGRGLYQFETDKEIEIGETLIGIHSPQCAVEKGKTELTCRNHSAVLYSVKAPTMGKATVADDVKAAKATDQRKQPPPEAGIHQVIPQPSPDVTSPGKATPATDAPKSKGDSKK